MNMRFTLILRASLLCCAALVFTHCAPQQNVGCGASAEDGRFTIGTGTKRLMYGYPAPHSTSHFVVFVNGKYGSNNPCVGNGKATYLYGTQQKWGERGSLFTKISYDFEGVRITQSLIPVDKQFKDVEPNSFGQYYRIEYTLENIGTESATVGITLLIDTMIDTNDGSQMEADGTRVATETKFVGQKIPSSILVYKVPGSKSELVAECVTNKGKAMKPDEFYIGRWRNFYPQVWNIESQTEQYGDSGFILKWNEQQLPAGATRTVATHYGLPSFAGEAAIQAVSYDPFVKRIKTEVYFDFADDKLTAQSKQNLDELLMGRSSIQGLFVEVYTDAVGKDASNLKLSERRAESIARYLESKRISRDKMIMKSFGEQFADKAAETQSGGKQSDRRADVTIYLQE